MRDLPPIVEELDHPQPQTKETIMQDAMPTRTGQPRPTISTQSHFCPPPSPSISELALGEFDANDHLISAAYEALKSCRVAAHSTHAACVAVHADTTLSEGARHVSAADVAGKVTARPLPLVDAAGSKIAGEITRIETKIKQPLVDSTIRACQVATELRLYLRDQSPTERHKTITRSIESGDDQVLSAIMTAPAMLSGLYRYRGFELCLGGKRDSRTSWPELPCSKRCPRPSILAGNY